MTEQLDAVVVGSGPNGLAAAVALAMGGRSVTVLEAADTPGGGARSAELTIPGLVHDTCSGVHPFGVGSPFLSTLPLGEHGLVWRWPEIDLAHPLDDGSAALLHRDLDRTCDGLGPDGRTWRRIFGPLVARFDELAGDVLGPVLRWPDHPVLMARFGLRAILPANAVGRAFRTESAKSLWAGSAAHLFHRFGRPFSAAVGLMLIAGGHAHGWPVAEGGSGAISAALVSLLEAHGGTVVTGHRVASLADLPPSRALLLDTAPGAAAGILGDRLPRRRARTYRRFRHGPAAFKVDLAVRGGIPWAAETAGRAGTVHVGGSLADIASAEAATVRGEMPARPFVLVAQQSVADPGRAVGDVHPIYAYAHVPAGWSGDGEQAVVDQIERFAPGFTERIVATASTGPARLQASNPNLVQGDIVGGANDPLQLVARPRLGLDPYATGAPGVFLCSASTPPGAGVHGMAGFHAAMRALRWLDGR
ncbi:phytoene desaturase family protein [Dermatobacter hominis]|uniref:phytoene desaturase family protein n=1 Tax=Dermatobacter hominis TaxID=2884263 RepID=UPI001D0FC8B9|nr:NAD(P)/FAD-dependent oxidoreductase [Dermatobacter hominis]UDY35183.1 NAD(P)/FAD-dependent oxidoreductase [Dermatobacter hominis]